MAWAPDYATVDELHNYLRIPDVDTVDDPELALANTAAARAIDEVTNRQFGKVDAAEQRLYTAVPDYGTGCWVVDIDDVQDQTGMTVTVDGTAVTVFTLEPVNAAAKGRPWTSLAFTTDSEAQPTGKANEVAATAPWGWTSVPDTVKQAALLQGNRFYSRRGAPFGVAGSPEMGNELRLLAKADPDVAVMLANYRRLRKVG